MARSELAPQLLLVGLNHKTAPLHLRERFVMGEALQNVLDVLKRCWCDHPRYAHCGRACATCGEVIHYEEACVLSTCNRTEVYALGHKTEPLIQLLASYGQVAPEALAPHLYTRTGQGAVAHLFRVAGGLDSQVLGEPQILGQVRDHFERASAHESAGPVLSALFRRALRAGKRVRTETALGRFPACFGSVVAQLIGARWTDPGTVRVAVLGAGEMGEAVAVALKERKVRDFTLVNRTSERARDLARRLGGASVPWDRLDRVLGQADVVVCATGTGDYVLDATRLERAQAARQHAPLLVVDLALPRNVSPKAAQVCGVALFDLDALQTVVGKGHAKRRAEIPRAETIVAEELEAFRIWLRERQVAPYIELLRQRAEGIRRGELDWALPKLGELDARQRAVVEALSARLVNKLLHGHTQRFKHLARQAEEPDALLAQLFGFRSNGLANPERIQQRAKEVEPLSAAKARMRAAKEVVS